MTRQTRKIEVIEKKPAANIAEKFATLAAITDKMFDVVKTLVKPDRNIVKKFVMPGVIIDKIDVKEIMATTAAVRIAVMLSAAADALIRKERAFTIATVAVTFAVTKNFNTKNKKAVFN